MIPAVEIMKIVPAIQEHDSETAKNYQIDNVIQTSGELGMVSMDQYIFETVPERRNQRRNRTFIRH